MFNTLLRELISISTMIIMVFLNLNHCTLVSIKEVNTCLILIYLTIRLHLKQFSSRTRRGSLYLF
jgi:hypothetical protein